MIRGVWTRATHAKLATSLSLLTALTLGVVTLAASGCGSSDRRSDTSTHVPTPTSYLNDGDKETGNDEDQDNLTADNDNDYPEDHLKTENNSYRDSDDNVIVNTGHTASAADRQTITALVKRYLAAELAGNGAATCSMMTPAFAQSIPEDYGKSQGPAYLRGGKTCTAVMTKLLQHSRTQLTTNFVVSGVRVAGNQGYALLGSYAAPASYVAVARKRHRWTVETLLSSPLP